MKEFTLYRKQIIDTDIETAWDFFSSPLNLQKITPPYMNFKILSGFTQETKMYEGMIIKYKVSPIFHIPLTWVTKITKVIPLKEFVDVQLQGPYVKWEHLHKFEIKDGKIEMIDKVNYILPMGILGEIAHNLFIKKQLDEIFDYRYEVIDVIFNQKQKVLT